MSRAQRARNLPSNETEKWMPVLPEQGEQRGAWRSTDMSVSLCPASASALYRGPSPERRPSSAAEP